MKPTQELQCYLIIQTFPGIKRHAIAKLMFGENATPRQIYNTHRVLYRLNKKCFIKGYQYGNTAHYYIVVDNIAAAKENLTKSRPKDANGLFKR